MGVMSRSDRIKNTAINDAMKKAHLENLKLQMQNFSTGGTDNTESETNSLAQIAERIARNNARIAELEKMNSQSFVEPKLDRELRAKESAEQLMRQLLGDKYSVPSKK